MWLFIFFFMIVSLAYFSQFHYMMIFLCEVKLLKDWSLDLTDTACKTQIKHMCHFYMILQTTLKCLGYCTALTYKVVYSVCLSKNSIHVILNNDLEMFSFASRFKPNQCNKVNVSIVRSVIKKLHLKSTHETTSLCSLQVGRTEKVRF